MADLKTRIGEALMGDTLAQIREGMTSLLQEVEAERQQPGTLPGTHGGAGTGARGRQLDAGDAHRRRGIQPERPAEDLRSGTPDVHQEPADQAPGARAKRCTYGRKVSPCVPRISASIPCCRPSGTTRKTAPN